MKNIIYLLFFVFMSGCGGSDNNTETADHSAQGDSLSVANKITRIFDVQGKSHRSPYTGLKVTVPGIITAIQDDGIFLQDPLGDNDPDTSDAIHVSLQSTDKLVVGEQVIVTGIVRELKSGSNRRQQLSLTDLRSAIVSADATFFADNSIIPVVIGGGGRVIPGRIIDNDSSGSVTDSLVANYDPEEDGIDFYESLEAMLVSISSARVVGPVNYQGEYWVTPEPVAGHSGTNYRGGLTIAETTTGIDYNPERIQLDDELTGKIRKKVNVGSGISEVEGVLGYSSGNYELLLTKNPIVTNKFLPYEKTRLEPLTSALTVATYNVKNLDPNDADGDQDVWRGQFRMIALQIVRSLKSPDVIALQEVQDNDGSVESRTTSARETLMLLVDEIKARGGPAYAFENINPVNNADGGQPGGNIRVAWLYNPQRVSLINPDRGGKQEEARVFAGSEGLEMNVNPGRVSPQDDAFRHSRKPLAILFGFQGNRVLMVNSHFSSKRESSPLFGDLQPPVNGGERKRLMQSGVVKDFVTSALSVDENAAVVVLGDFNEFNFMPALQQLQGTVTRNDRILTNLLELLPAEERYTYVRHGNSQAIDHIFVSDALTAGAEVDIVHMNAEYARQISDHDPVVARLVFR